MQKKHLANTTHIHDKNSPLTENIGEIPPLTKNNFKKRIVNIILNGQKLDSSLLRSETSQGCPH